MRDRMILRGFTIVGILLLGRAFFKKPPIKNWIVIYMSNSILNYIINNFLVSKKYLAYPIRFTPHLFKINTVYDFIICPLISIWYCQSTYRSKWPTILSKSFLFAVPQLFIELWAKRDTKLIRYQRGWTWLHSLLTIMAVKLGMRGLFAKINSVKK